MRPSQNRAILSLSLALTLVLAACGPTAAPVATTATSAPSTPAPTAGGAQVPGVTTDTIVLGMTAAQSGPVSTIGIPLAHGIEAYFNMVNEAGGVHGRKIKLIVEDDQYAPSNTVAVTKKLVEQDNVFAIVRPLGTAQGAAVMDYLVSKNVPVVGVASGSSLWSKPFKKTYFGIQPTYADEGTIMAQYALDDLKAQRIAVFFQNDAFGKEGADAFVAALKQRGVDVVASVPYEATETNFSAHALKLQEAKPDLVFMYAIVSPAAQVMKEAEKLGFRPQWLMTYVLADPVLFKLAGESAVEGAQAGAWLVDPANAPEAAAYRDAMKKYFPNEPPGGYSLSSYAVGEMIVEALKRAGPDLTREKFIAALESLKDFTTGLTPPITYTAEDHQGIKQIAIVQAQKGQWVTLKPFFGVK